MVNIEKERLLDYDTLKMDLLKRVNEAGPLGETESWRKAFPEIVFGDEDDGESREGDYSGAAINWDERTVAEKMFYVVFKTYKEIEVGYSIIIEDVLKVNQVVRDRESIWWMWKDGCFSDEDLTEEARRDFVQYSFISGERLKGEHVEDINLSEVWLEEIKVKVGL